MKRSIGCWQLFGFAAVSLAGTLLHFLFDWTGGALWTAPFSGVNESTWEHMKLLFWPMFLYACFQYIFFRDTKNFWCIQTKGILLGLALIPVLFYTYNGVVGQSPDWINIAIFFISAAIAYLYQTSQFRSGTTNCRWEKLSFLILCVIAGLFVLFTFSTPQLGVFKDPITGRYGLNAA